jgi:hypothetical protein
MHDPGIHSSRQQRCRPWNTGGMPFLSKTNSLGWRTLRQASNTMLSESQRRVKDSLIPTAERTKRWCDGDSSKQLTELPSLLHKVARCVPTHADETTPAPWNRLRPPSRN